MRLRNLSGRFEKTRYEQPALAVPALLEHGEILAMALPRDHMASGVYFLFQGDEVVYVGQSANMPVRLHRHRLEGEKEFDRYAMVTCPEPMMSPLERLYIRRFAPRYNVAEKPMPVAACS